MDRVKVKICGLKSIEDVEIVNKYLPDYVGFVFANTKRFVPDELAAQMKQKLDPKIKAVGVFVNEPVEHVISLCRQSIIDVVQLHGDETDDYVRKLKQETDICVIKAIRVQTKEQVLANISRQADYHLFDTYKKGEPGGTGECFSLDILQEALRLLEPFPFFIAGGLTPHNATQILEKQKCFGLDISTGVETAGKKDEEKIKAFIRTVRDFR